MRFKKKYDIRNEENRKIISRGFWRPTAKDYRDIIEDYIRIARIRRGNNLAISKLQMHLLEDLITHQKILDNLKKQSESNPQNIEYVKQEIFVQEAILRNLQDIADGIAFRYFEYDRALLHYLGIKPAKGPVRPHPGLIVELQVWSEAFDYGQAKAIMNDITNYLKIGDVTVFKDSGEIEFIEVKSGKSTRGKERRARLTRQQNKLEETVKFFNTGITEFDGRDLVIKKIPVALDYKFELIMETVQKAKECGMSHCVIEDYLIVECIDCQDAKRSEDFIPYFEKHTAPVRDEWRKKKDYIFGPLFFHERLDFSHNLTPISIWPLDDTTCADLMMGRLMLTATANISEIQRKFEKEGWTIEKSVWQMKKEEIEASGMKSLMTVRKNGFFVEVPPGMLARNIFEFLSPTTLINTFQWNYENTPKDQSGLILMAYEKEKDIWN